MTSIQSGLYADKVLGSPLILVDHLEAMYFTTAVKDPLE